MSAEAFWRVSVAMASRSRDLVAGYWWSGMPATEALDQATCTVLVWCSRGSACSAEVWRLATYDLTLAVFSNHESIDTARSNACFSRERTT